METLTEKRRYGTIADFNTKTSNHWEKRYVFVLKHNNAHPSVEGKFFPNSYNIKLQDQIFDKKTQKSRIIRVVPGAMSIFKDEQSEDEQKSDPIFKSFSKNGDLVVEAQEEQTLKFLMMCNWNETNVDRNTNIKAKFGLLDLRQGLDMEVKKDEAESEAANWCYKADFKHIIRYARVLGLDTEVDPDQLRHALRQLAKRDAVKFNDGLKNKYTTRKFYVLDAMDKGIVTVDLRTNTISWSNGNIITASPVGKHPVDHFVDLSCSTTDFDMSYRTLHELVEPTTEKIETKKPEVKNTTQVDDTSTLNVNITTEKLIEDALKKGVIVQTKSWLTFLDTKLQVKRFYEEVANKPLLKEAIIKAVSEVK